VIVVAARLVRLNNPNVVAACGCGSSFQVKDEAEDSAAVTA